MQGKFRLREERRWGRGERQAALVHCSWPYDGWGGWGWDRAKERPREAIQVSQEVLCKGLFHLFERQSGKEMGKRQTESSSPGSLPEWPQWPQLVQAKVRSQELLPWPRPQQATATAGQGHSRPGPGPQQARTMAMPIAGHAHTLDFKHPLPNFKMCYHQSNFNF